MPDGRLDRSKSLYERAVFGGDAAAIDEGLALLDAVTADLALSRARLLHARFLVDRQPDPRELELAEEAAALFERVGDTRGHGEALFWTGIYHQVCLGDHATAAPLLARALALATAAGDDLTRSYVVRHLAFVEMNAGRLDAARPLLEESVELRRKVGHQAGIAAGLLALAHLAHEQGRTADVPDLLDEASATAEAADAAGVRNWITESRAALEQPPQSTMDGP
jgi:hypothetical protein